MSVRIVVKGFMVIFLIGFAVLAVLRRRSISSKIRSVVTEIKVWGGRCSPLSFCPPFKGGSLFTALLVIFILTLLFPQTSRPQEKPLVWEVYFSPRGGATDAIVRELSSAKKTIMVQAYSFTSSRIAGALLNAHKRGVKVEVVLDKKQRTDKYSSATFLFNQGISVKIDLRCASNHNKVMIIDEVTVITGSFNFTKAAEEGNAENLLVIRDVKLASLYLKNFQKHCQHSEVYTPRSK